MKKFPIMLVWLLITLVTSACTAPTPQGTAPPTPAVPHTAGMALMRGRLVNASGGVIANRSIYLATVYGSGDKQAYVFDSGAGVGGVTDADGAFALNNIPPGRYVLLLVLGEGQTIAILDTNGSEKIWELTADQLTDVQTVRIQMPSP
ncbi:MAG: hypothetical protein RL076_1708 [Chloroflexota bacterium]